MIIMVWLFQKAEPAFKLTKGALCLSVFDAVQSSLFDQCERSAPCPSTAHLVSAGKVKRVGLRLCGAHARAQARSADITVTVCGGFTLNSDNSLQGRNKSCGKSSVCVID